MSQQYKLLVRRCRTPVYAHSLLTYAIVQIMSNNFIAAILTNLNRLWQRYLILNEPQRKYINVNRQQIQKKCMSSKGGYKIKS